MILHLVTDEKFTDYAIKQFSDFINSSEFILVTYVDDPLKYVSLEQNVRVIKYGSEEYNNLCENLDKYKAILSHGLFERWQQEIILKAPSNVKVAWMFWGGEVYGLPICRNKFLSFSSKLLHWAKRLAYIIKRKNDYNSYSNIPIEVFKRIDYCLTDEYEEFEFANNLLRTNMKHLWYNYYSIEDTVGSLANKSVNGENILIGNSSTFESNHLMALKKLRRFSLKNKKIIVPLSYGDSWLKARLLKLGKFLFPKNFEALVSFMPREEYNMIMCSCAYVVMPHYRPQAFGNILTALWLGAKVFISNKNIVYPFYKRLGVHFYTLETDLTTKELEVPLSQTIINKNREILMKEYSRDAMKPRIQNVVEELNR